MNGIRAKVAVGAAVLAVGALPASAAVADDNGDSGSTHTTLTGYEEVPAVSTSGSGTFHADLAGDRITYRLSYRGLSSPVLMAHIHFGQTAVNGGVAAFLCADDPAVGAPACPDSGTVRGTITAEDVIGPAEQGIAPGELDELLTAMRHGVTYANVHTETFPDGEIRGQLDDDRDDDRDDDD